MRKRAISAVLAASMMLSVVPAPAFAAGNRAEGGTLPDEVTAQTLGQTNAEEIKDGNYYNETISGDVTITGGQFQNVTFTGDVEIDGGYFMHCTFEGEVTIDSDSNSIQRCTFNKDVEVWKFKDGEGNTFYGHVDVSKLGTEFRNDSFLGGVEGGSLGFTSCTLSGEIDTYASSTFNNCVIVGNLPAKVDSSSWSKVTVGDGLAGNTFKFAASTQYDALAEGTEAWYQEKVVVSGDISQITNINENEFPDSYLTVVEKYRVDVIGSYFQLRNLNNSVNNITLTHQEAPLELGSNGYPKDANGNETDGTKDVTASTWEYSAKDKTLTLKSGNFDLTGQTTSCDLVIEKDATLTGLYYTGSKITNKGTISGGTYESATIDIQRGASVIGGTYGATVSFQNNGPTGGIFLSALPDSTEIKLKDASNFTFNGLSLPAGSDTIYAIADGTNEQTLKIAYTGSEKIYSWGASFGDTSLGRFYVTDNDTTVTNQQLGATITANNKAISVSLSDLAAVNAMAQQAGTPTLEAVHKPTYRAKDVTVKLGDQEISNNARPTYSPDLTKITVTDKSGEKTFVKDTDYTATLTDAEGNEVENFDGKPGEYQLAITFKDTEDHTGSAVVPFTGVNERIQYSFTITKADMNAELFEKYYTVKLPGDKGDGKVAYDGKAHCATVTKNADAPAALNGEVQVKHYEDNPFGSYDSVEPTKPGSYDVEIFIPYNDYYKQYGSVVGTITITKATLPENTFSYDPETGKLTSNDPAIDADEFTKSNVTYKDAEGNEYTETQLKDAPAGEYTVCVTVTDNEGRYKDVTFETAEKKTVEKRDLSEEIQAGTATVTIENTSAAYNGGEQGVTVTVSGVKFGEVSNDDITVTYKDAEGNELVGEPKNAGTYTYTVTIENSNYNKQELAEGTFTIEPRTLTADEISCEVPENVTTTNISDKLAELKAQLAQANSVEADDVTITLYDEDGNPASEPLAEGTYTFKVSIAASANYSGISDVENDSWTFTVEQGTIEPDPDPIDPDGDGGAAVAAVIGTAAVGGAAYLVGTQVWLETNLPKGAAIPTNRQQLADLLWTTAGKPEPRSNVLYTDIAATAADSQKAARWCVEQGLLKDNGETFQPNAYTFRPQVIKAWTDLQAQLKADNK